jgi:hypothetical protein
VHADELAALADKLSGGHGEELGAKDAKIHELEAALTEAHAELLAEMDRGGQLLTPEEAQRVAEEAAIAAKSAAEETGRQDSALAMGSHVEKHRELESEIELIRREKEAELEAWQDRAKELELALDEAEDDLQVVQEAHDALEKELYQMQDGYDSRDPSLSQDFRSGSRPPSARGASPAVTAPGGQSGNHRVNIQANMKDAISSLKASRVGDKPVTSLRDVRLKEKMWKSAKRLDDEKR